MKLKHPRAVAITATSQYHVIDEHNRGGMEQPRYFPVFFSIRLRPSYFTHHACVLNISNDNNVLCWFVQWLSKFALNKPKQTANEREIDWSCEITFVCRSGRVMYICENKLSCPRKAKSVLALKHCWSAEPLKVALKVKMISTACFITYLFEWISHLNMLSNERLKTHSKTLLPTPRGETMKQH